MNHAKKVSRIIKRSQVYLCTRTSKYVFPHKLYFQNEITCLEWPNVILGQKQRYSVGKICNQFISMDTCVSNQSRSIILIAVGH